VTRSFFARLVPPFVLVLGLLAAWEAWVRWRGTPTYVVPAPTRVAGAGVESAHLLGDPIVVTMTQTIVGLLVGAGIGLVLAFVIVAVPTVRGAVGPLLIASQTFPTILLAPLLVVTFGLGPTPKIVLVALVTFFPVVIATTAGLDAADDEYVDLVRALGGGRTTVLRVVQAPAAIPSFFSGLRIASAWAVAAAVLGQMNGGDRGLGVFINRSRSSFQVDRLYAAFVVIALLSGLLYALVGLLGRLATPWLHVRARATSGPAAAVASAAVIAEPLAWSDQEPEPDLDLEPELDHSAPRPTSSPSRPHSEISS
jgi:ABC-type nitrate/sulfonate/bicarbonate transport system permease component